MLSIAFVIIVIGTVLLFFRASHYHRTTIIVLISWLLLQMVPSLLEFYTVTDAVPPRFVLLIWPPLIFIIILFSTQSGRTYISALDLKYLTILHAVRIFVELVLFGLFIRKMVPEVMTFAGRNFDILAGVSAPIVYYLYFVRRSINGLVLLWWNFFCLVLLVNIVSTAILSAPFPFQRLGFEQPDIGILYFPFTWLPCCVVPIVLLSHLAAVRQLWNPGSRETSSQSIS